jgi:hypothetical protein
MGSDGFDSPGSSIFGKPGFNFLPYGVHSPSADSLMSTGSREMMSGSYMGMKIFKNFYFLKTKENTRKTWNTDFIIV